MKVWGITGTNGKTTVTWMLAEFLKQRSNAKVGYITTVEVDTSLRRFYTGYTTPPLTQLKDIFAEMESNGVTDCAMEVSSHAIHQHRTGDTCFAGGAFTNLSQDHLDYHKTMEAYFDVKLDFARRISSSVSNLSPDSGRADMPPFVVCMDGGEWSKRMLEEAGKLTLNVIPVSMATPKFDLSEFKLPGDFNRSNVLTAAALAQAAGIKPEKIQAVIPALRSRWGRLELVKTSSRAAVYVDFAHTPDGINKVLLAVRGFTTGKVWCVFGAGGDRDRTKRPKMGMEAAKGADVLVVTSDNPRSENPESIIAEIVAGIPQEKRMIVEPDRRKAIYFALAQAEIGDTVVVCGKGHENTQEIAGVKYPFDDRKVCAEY